MSRLSIAGYTSYTLLLMVACMASHLHGSNRMWRKNKECWNKYDAKFSNIEDRRKHIYNFYGHKITGYNHMMAYISEMQYNCIFLNKQ